MKQQERAGVQLVVEGRGGKFPVTVRSKSVRLPAGPGPSSFLPGGFGFGVTGLPPAQVAEAVASMVLPETPAQLVIDKDEVERFDIENGDRVLVSMRPDGSGLVLRELDDEMVVSVDEMKLTFDLLMSLTPREAEVLKGIVGRSEYQSMGSYRLLIEAARSRVAAEKVVEGWADIVVEINETLPEGFEVVLSETHLDVDTTQWVRKLFLVLPSLYAAHHGARRLDIDQRFDADERVDPSFLVADIVKCCLAAITEWDAALAVGDEEE